MDAIDIRPRSIGEILDDAWRLYLGDAPVLLALSGLFTVPAAVTILLLCALPRSGSGAFQVLFAALAAVALPLTGLGSGVCQEAFRQLAEAKPLDAWTCLRRTLRLGLEHVAARSIFLSVGVIGTLALLFPGVGLWACSITVHPFLAEEGRLSHALESGFREARRNSVKALVLTLVRPLLLLFLAINLHLFLLGGIWVVETLGGLDLALAGVLVELRNATYDLALLLVCWCLLVPYVEAVNFLFHVDARARYEGLDLWHRVQRLFPGARHTRAGTVLLCCLGALVLSGPVMAADRAVNQLEIVRAAHQEVAAIRNEVEKTEPYPGGGRWSTRLREVADRLDRGNAPGSFRWFRQAIEGFTHRKRDDALIILADLTTRLRTLEESLERSRAEPPELATSKPRLSKEEIKRSLPNDGEQGDRNSRETPPAKKPEEKKPVADDPVDDGPGPSGRGGPGMVMPMPRGGLTTVVWVILLGMLAAALAVYGAHWWRNRPGPKAKPKPTRTRQAEERLDSIFKFGDQNMVQRLWSRAEELAAAGKFLQAVRTIHLAALAVLHKANIIRYEPTRTNGEYLAQLQSREEVLKPFGGLTRRFELTWYGERTCEPADYERCRELAEEIRGVV